MHHRWIIPLGILLLSLTLVEPASASTGNLGAIIESFIAQHFPDATSHFWVINDTQWDGDEMVVDIHTVVLEKQLPVPVENRYLLLIVHGQLTAAQRIPLGDGSGCQPDET